MRKSIFGALSLALTVAACTPSYAQDAASSDKCITAAEKLDNVKAANPDRSDWKYIIALTGADAHDALARLTALVGQPVEGAAVSVISADGFGGGRVVVFDDDGCALGSGLLPMKLVEQVFGAQG